MDISLLEHMDRLSAKKSLRSRYGSFCGVIATLGMIALIVWMYYWAVLDFSLGWFFQTSFQIPQASVQKFQIPYDLKAAIVFSNKTTNQPVNHTLLADTLKIRAYQSSVVSSTQYYQSLSSCRSDYFSDAINPITMTDCFIFPDNLAFDYYYQNTVASMVGMYMTFGCLNPFFCKSGNAVYNAALGNFSNAFNMSHFVVYFATRVIQPDGSFRYQVNSISSSEWNTPYTISGTFDAEIQSINTTVDDSIWPWINNKTTSSLSWFGMVKGVSKNATALQAPLPKLNFVSSYYQNQVFRYYKKIDWLLGIIGGGMSLFFILLWIPLQYLNRSFQHSSYAEELLIDYKNSLPTTVRDLKPVKMSFLYPLKRLIGCSDAYQQQLKDKLDITKIIGKLKVAQRNIQKLKLNVYAKERRLVFLEDLTNKCPENGEIQQNKIIIVRVADGKQQNVEGQLQNNDNSYAILNGSSAGIKAEERFQELEIESPVKEPDIHPYIENQIQDQPQKIPIQYKPQLQILIEHKNQALTVKNTFFMNSISEPMPRLQEIFEPHQLIDLSDNVNQNELKIEKENEVIRSNAQISRSKRSSAENEEQRDINYQRQSQQNRPPSQFHKSNRQNEEEEAGRNSHLPLEPQQVVAEFPTSEDEQLLNMQKEVLIALSESNQTRTLYPGKGVVLLIGQQNQNQLRDLIEIEKYNNLDSFKVETRCNKVLNKLAAFIRRFDFFGVKPDFINSPANASVIGCLVTFAIVACAVITFALTIQNASNYQVIATKDFESPQEISYKLITGQGFRPAACFLSTGAAKLAGSGQTVTLQFYSYSASLGSVDIPTIQMKSGEGSLLGITSDSLFSTLTTENCWRMQDGYEIPLGGPGSNEAYFGFRINGYCSGTVSYCNSVIFTTRSNTATFLNTYPMTIYLPINQYSPRSNSIFEGGVINQALKEGLGSIVFNATVEQTLYVDRVELIDAYSSNFVGQSYPVMQKSICSSRYQQNEFTRPIPNTYPGYELRIRPSGVVNKVILKGYSLQIILGIIGGVFFIWYFLFSCIGKSYNAFNIRARLAQQIYYEESYDNSFFLKFCHLLSYPILFACGMCKQDLKRMRQVDRKIKQDLEAIELIKDVDTCYRLSAAKLTPETRMVGMINFKQKVDEKQSMNAAPPEVKQQQEFMSEVFIEELSESQESTNKINNEFEVAIVNQNNEEKNNVSEKPNEKLVEDIDQIAAESTNRGPYSRTNSKWRSFVASIDLFSCDTQLSLFGQWSIKSVFGTLMTAAAICFGLIIYTHFIDIYVQQKNYTISYEKYISPTVLNQSLQLNENNFRFALGFYTKPNFAFLNVSTLVNSTVSGTVGISIYQNYIQWKGSSFTLVDRKYDLVPCTSNYFSNFVNRNIDSNYYANLGLANGFCLPSGMTFSLAGMNPKKMDYFRISIYNKTSTSTALTTLTSTYVVGCLMTVPVINLQGRSFNYSIQQIRMNSEVVTRSYQFNITLSRQEMQFPNPVDGTTTTIQSYGYEENRAFQRSYLASSTLSTVSRTYNITFSYAGFVQSYKTVYTKPSQLFGLAGGIFTLFLVVAGYLAYSFNRFRMIYLVGQRLYAFTLKKKKQTYEDALLLREINDYSESKLLWAWLLSFPASIVNRYDWNNTLRRVSVIQKRAAQDLDLYRFYSRFATVRDTLNREFKLQKYPHLLLTNLYSKELVPQESWQYISQGPLKITAKYHGLSSRDQWILEQAQNAQMPLNDFMSQVSQQVESQVNLSEAGRQVLQLQQQGEAEGEQLPPPPPADLPLEKLFEFEAPAEVEPTEKEKVAEPMIANSHVVEQMGFEEIGDNSDYSDSQN